MKASFFAALIGLGLLWPSSIFANEVWIVAKRESRGALVYTIDESELRNLDEIASFLMKKRKKLSSFPPVRAVFDPNCTFDDFSNLRGWLGKIGVLDSKYYLTDAKHRAISEIGMIGGQLAFPSSTAAASGDERQP